MRSSREPSRMPASTPISSATGTMIDITQNIRMPVAVSAWGRRFDDLGLEGGGTAEVALQDAGEGRLPSVRRR